MSDAAEILSSCIVCKTSLNLRIVWQILTDLGQQVTGPPEAHGGGFISGRIGWQTKREANAALAELRRMYGVPDQPAMTPEQIAQEIKDLPF